jgi:hypothetical protein
MALNSESEPPLLDYVKIEEVHPQFEFDGAKHPGLVFYPDTEDSEPDASANDDPGGP